MAIMARKQSEQETRLCRTETRSREGCKEFCEWMGCVWELDNRH